MWREPIPAMRNPPASRVEIWNSTIAGFIKRASGFVRSFRQALQVGERVLEVFCFLVVAVFLWKRLAFITLGTAVAVTVASWRWPARVTPQNWRSWWTVSQAKTYGSTDCPQVSRVPALLAQLKDPVNWDKGRLTTSSENALRWRLLPPVVAGRLGLGPEAYLQAARWGALMLLMAAGWYAGTAGRGAAVVILTATSSAWLWSWHCVGQFDWIYLLLLLWVSFSPLKILVLLAEIAGPWVDERFILALPAVWWLRRRLNLSGGAWVLPGLLPYLLARAAACAGGDLSVAHQLRLQAAQLSAEYWWHWLPVGWFMGWRLGWLLLAAAAAVAVGRGWLRRDPALLTAATLGFGAVTFLAWDSTRSAAMLLPFTVAAVRKLPAFSLPLLAISNLALPAILWMNSLAIPL